MFETAVVGAGKTARPAAVSVSALGQVILVAGGLLYFALRVEPLPKVQLRSIRDVAQVVEVQRPRESRPAAAQPADNRLRVPARRVDVSQLLARGPVTATATDVTFADTPEFDLTAVGPLRGSVPTWSETASRPAPPARPDPPKPKPAPVAQPPAGPVTVGGDVQPPRLLREVKPVYPPLARQARIQGTVVIEAIISRDGTVRAARIASGHPLLVNAAIDAVRQWVYAPTKLNGLPVEVILMAEVNFRLSQ